MAPVAITAWTMTSALGRGRRAHREALRAGRGGLRVNDWSLAPLACHIGRVAGLEEVTLPDPDPLFAARNNQLAWLGLGQDGFLAAARAARERHGAGRVAVFLGSSTGNIDNTESAYRQVQGGRMPPALRTPLRHSLYSTTDFVARCIGATGPAMTVSTACSSSAKVFAMASRMLQLKLIDAALVGGVDSLCHSVLFGFNSLQLVSREACRPFDRARDGISVGEAAAFMLLERAADDPEADRLQLAGYGESSDAWHMSSPHPEGLGAELAMDAALARAALTAQDVDYVNLHGTATRKNDAVEAALVARRFPARTRASSTKGATGHTLGTAGALEAAIALLALDDQWIPGTIGCTDPEPVACRHLQLTSAAARVDVALSNSFGFGGNNACLVFRRCGAAQ